MLVIPEVELTQNSNRCIPAPPPGRKCLLHVNCCSYRRPRPASFRGACPPPPGPLIAEIYRRAITTARRTGGLAQLTHPVFHHGADTPWSPFLGA